MNSIQLINFEIDKSHSQEKERKFHKSPEISPKTNKYLSFFRGQKDIT